MNFHDSRGMFDAIAAWVEEHHVEVDWEAIMQCKWWVGPEDWVPPPKWSMPTPFPSRLTPPTATKLLFAQWWNGLHIRPELGDPLDNYVAPRISEYQNVVPTNHQPRGGEGVDPGLTGEAATGPAPWKIFLKQLAAIERIEIIELKLLKPEDRKALVRMAALEEELVRREVEHNRERVRRQMRGGAVSYMSRKAIPKLVRKARVGSLGAISELERRGWDRGEIVCWRELAIKKADRARELAIKRMEASGKVFNREINKVKKDKKKDNERADGVVETDEVVADNEVDLEPKRVGIERELEVIRVGPNPRILTCRYQELASERVCKVGVKTTANFVRGMKFRMAEPVTELEYAGVWRYAGKLPRFRGRW
jgi:hypothetical protein